MNTRTEVSAGGVIYRVRRGRAEVCLIATGGGKHWQLPKGIIERGEPAEEAARREVSEETGLTGEVEKPLDRIEYWYVWEGERIHKLVYFFLLHHTGGSTRLHDDEVDDARWFPIEDALDRLSFENERRVMRQAAGRIGTGEASAKARAPASNPGPGSSPAGTRRRRTPPPPAARPRRRPRRPS